MSDLKFTDLLKLDFRWPKIGDKLFVQNETPHEAMLARHPGERLYHLREGYKLAADLLVEQTETEAWKRKKLVYPIIYCYRHYLELTLKAMLEEYGVMREIKPNWSHHKLEKLWTDFRGLLRELDGDDQEDQGTDAVEQCIAEFAKIDPVSQTFRYPIDRRGKPFEVSFESVDLLQIRDTMESIENYFDGTDAYLNSLKENWPPW